MICRREEWRGNGEGEVVKCRMDLRQDGGLFKRLLSMVYPLRGERELRQVI